MSTTPAANWPDPVGSTRWYQFKFYVPANYVAATDTKWLDFTQWKGLHGGSPPIALELKRSGLRLGGARTNAGLIPNDGYLGPISFGTWTTLTVGIHFSTSASDGWVTVLRDGHEMLPQTSVATMDTYGGTGDAHADPIYVKQGIYRDTSWATQVKLGFGPLRVSNTQEAS